MKTENRTPTPTENDVDDLYFSVMSDDEDVFPISDSKYADGLQFQEVLLSSISRRDDKFGVKKLSVLPTKSLRKKVLLTGESSNPPSVIQYRQICTICYETYSSDVIFHNKNCSHLFCKECISHHIGTKLQENISSIKCPDPDCRSVIVMDECVDVVPPVVLERWSSALCESLVLSSQRFYCPFKDCSMLLIDDGDEDVSQAVCPSCQRLFCARCKVSWHVGYECVDYQSLDVNERNREDLLLLDLAKTQKWKRCPKCRFYVERREGCLHITCRCKYQFCYGCGDSWSDKHLSCHT